MIKPAPLRPYLWYDRPDCLKMKLQPGEAAITPMKHETFIVKEIGGQYYDALVPTHTMGEDLSTVPVAYVGDTGDGWAVLHLPTSNDGRPTWVIPEKYLESLLVQ